MKNTNKFFGIIVFVMIIGLSMTACSSDDKDDYSDGSEYWWSKLVSPNSWVKENNNSIYIKFYEGFDGKTRHIYFFDHSDDPFEDETYEIDLMWFNAIYFGSHHLWMDDDESEDTRIQIGSTYKDTIFTGWFKKQ